MQLRKFTLTASFSWFKWNLNQRSPTEGNIKIYYDNKLMYHKFLANTKQEYIARKLELSDNHNKNVWDLINVETGRNQKENINPKNICVNHARTKK